MDSDTDTAVAAEGGMPSYNHALAIGGAHAQFAAGHIDEPTRDKIIESARKALAARKVAQQQEQPKMPAKGLRKFGSIAPPAPYRKG